MSAVALGLLVHVDRIAGPAMLDAATRAESLGFDALWLRAAASTAVAAVAARTARIRVCGSVELAALDPVHVAEEWATADAIANGRVELVVRCDELDTEERRETLRERVDLLQRLWTEPEVTWSGRSRAPLAAVTLEPRPVQRPHPPIWIGGGSPRPAADLAAALGLPLVLSLRSAPARELAPIAAHYRTALVAAGHDPARARLGCCGAVGGSPAEVADQVAALRAALGLDLFVAQLDVGGLPPAEIARREEIFAAEVAPRLRA